MRVGFIGLGSQGGPMARRIIEAGYEVTLWARRPSTVEQFADTPARVAATPAELAAASDLVGICVVDDADVESVVNGVLDGLAPGSIIAVHSTVHPDTCRRLAERASQQGVALIDAPVLATFGDPVVHLGPLGAGQTAKLLNNLLFTAHLGTARSLLALGQALGVEPLRLGEVIGHGSGNSFALSRILAAGGTLDRIAAHAGALLRKDVRLVAALADAAGAPTGAVQASADAALAAMGVA
jgi:3-hydroxyisobutyrate dehydrogenase-like beta-hydroxyacid dehydrogenase